MMMEMLWTWAETASSRMRECWPLGPRGIRLLAVYGSLYSRSLREFGPERARAGETFGPEKTSARRRHGRTAGGLY